MTSKKISFFMEEIGNHYLRIPFSADWTGLNRRTFFKKKEIWPMVICNAGALLICGMYVARLLSYKDMTLDRSKVNTWDQAKVYDQVNMHTWIDLNHVKKLHNNRPNID